MQRAFIAALISTSLLLSATTTRDKTKVKTAKSTPKGGSRVANTKPGAKALASGRRSTSAGATKQLSRSNTPTASRLVRTKSGRWTRVVVHTPPPPSFQTHPDPDRYVEIQKALADRGYFKGEANGEWGDDSMDALRRFQAASHLPDDGKISALSLTGLGLGPRHDGSTAGNVPLIAPDAGASVPSSSSLHGLIAPVPAPGYAPTVPAAEPPVGSVPNATAPLPHPPSR